MWEPGETDYGAFQFPALLEFLKELLAGHGTAILQPTQNVQPFLTLAAKNGSILYVSIQGLTIDGSRF